MSKTMRRQVWIDMAFHRKLKREAAEKDMSLLEYTRKLARDLGQDIDDDGGERREKRFKPRLTF